MHYIIVLLLFGFNILYGQGHEAQYAANYSFKWVTDTTQMRYSESEDYLLYRIAHESRFLNYYAYLNDSIVHTFKDKVGDGIYTQEGVDLFFQTEMSKMRTHTSDLRLLKDFETNSATIILFNSNNRNYINEPLQLKWEMIDGIDTIAGMACYKASTQYGGRKYTAWYSTEIPISDGPYVFHGLPGLIIKVIDSNNWYLFEFKNISLNPNRHYVKPAFIEKTYPAKIDRNTFVEHSKDKKENPEFPYGMPNVTPEMKLKLKNKYKKRFDLLIEKN